MAAKKIIVLTSWLSALILLAPSAFAQSVAVNGLVCQILAADCSTIVSVQASSMSIALKSKGYYAICNAILPSNAFAPSDEKQVKCNFQNTGQNCIIGPSQDVTASCSSTTSNSSAQTSIEITTSDGTQSTMTSLVSTADWQEIIQPNGNVSIKCQAPTIMFAPVTDNGG
jgi:hypothetical protein